jgi:hypothetical protein
MWSRFLTGTLQRKPRKIEDSNESQSLPTTPVANQRGLRRLDAWIGSLLRDGEFLGFFGVYLRFFLMLPAANSIRFCSIMILKMPSIVFNYFKKRTLLSKYSNPSVFHLNV